MNSQTDRPLVAALAALITLQLIMLTALYAGVRPHPPVETPLFGIAPFLGASIAACIASMILGPSAGAGRILAVAAAVMAAISFGPQKYFDAQFPLIWPAVIGGQIAIASILVAAFGTRRAASGLRPEAA